VTLDDSVKPLLVPATSIPSGAAMSSSSSSTSSVVVSPPEEIQIAPVANSASTVSAPILKKPDNWSLGFLNTDHLFRSRRGRFAVIRGDQVYGDQWIDRSAWSRTDHSEAKKFVAVSHDHRAACFDGIQELAPDVASRLIKLVKTGVGCAYIS